MFPYLVLLVEDVVGWSTSSIRRRYELPKVVNHLIVSTFSSVHADLPFWIHSWTVKCNGHLCSIFFQSNLSFKDERYPHVAYVEGEASKDLQVITPSTKPDQSTELEGLKPFLFMLHFRNIKIQKTFWYLQFTLLYFVLLPCRGDD